MKNRNDRLMVIRKLVDENTITSQDELMSMLENDGFSLTQATLSRDLKYLKVAKMPDNLNGYVYMLTEKQLNEPSSQDDVPVSGIVSMDFAQGMGILKTLPGHAGMIAYSIDNMNSYEIAGTIAGDDTILLVPRDGVSKLDVINLLKRRVPGFHDSIV